MAELRDITAIPAVRAEDLLVLEEEPAAQASQ
jgi:hypothetical protein